MRGCEWHKESWSTSVEKSFRGKRKKTYKGCFLERTIALLMCLLQLYTTAQNEIFHNMRLRLLLPNYIIQGWRWIPNLENILLYFFVGKRFKASWLAFCFENVFSIIAIFVLLFILFYNLLSFDFAYFVHTVFLQRFWWLINRRELLILTWH